MNTLMGFKVHSSPLIEPVPRLRLHPDFKWCTPEFRAEYNAWLLERFGTRDVVYMFQRSAFGEDCIVMNQRQIAMLRLLPRHPEVHSK